MKKIYGRKPVLEALNSGAQIDQILLAFNQHGNVINRIKQTAKRKGIKLSQLSNAKFKKYDEGNTQGVIALVSSQKYLQLDDLLIKVKDKQNPLLLILDQIQDPHNLGAILRTAEACGVDGVLITMRNSASINETVEKTSAGAVSHLDICQVNNLNNVINVLKENRFWIVGTHLEGAKPYTDVDYNSSIAIVVGNEEKGIRRLISEGCDHLVKIPMIGKIQSLNVSVSTGILLYEVIRQRN